MRVLSVYTRTHARTHTRSLLPCMPSAAASGIGISLTCGPRQLGEKKKAFMEMTEEQKKEAKAKAGGGRGEAKHGGGGGGGGKSELAVVNISCTAPDKVSVNIEYPALSASA